MLSSRSVLVVDDEINLCRILGAKLAKSGFSVVAVHDGQQAIDKVRESNFDVVLLDLMLPKVDGLSALAEIRNMNHDMTVIIMTACENSEALETAKSHGVSAYINKPFDLDNLVELVQSTSTSSIKHQCKRSADSTVLFSKGKSVSLDILNGRAALPYQCLIEGRDERALSIVMPFYDGRLIDVTPRTPVRVGLAANDAYYSFNSYVSSVRDEEPPVVVIDKPGVIYRSQRRQSQRFNVEMDIKLGKISDEFARPDRFFAGKSCDLSAGGIKLITSEPLTPGDMVYVETDKSSVFTPINAMARVLRTEQTAGSDFSVAMQFKELLKTAVE